MLRLDSKINIFLRILRLYKDLKWTKNKYNSQEGLCKFQKFKARNEWPENELFLHTLIQAVKNINWVITKFFLTPKLISGCLSPFNSAFFYKIKLLYVEFWLKYCTVRIFIFKFLTSKNSLSFKTVVISRDRWKLCSTLIQSLSSYKDSLISLPKHSKRRIVR